MKIQPTIFLRLLAAIAAIVFLGIQFDYFPFPKTIISTITIVSVLYYFNAQLSAKQLPAKFQETFSRKSALFAFFFFLTLFFFDLYFRNNNIFVSSIGIVLIIVGAFIYAKSVLYLDKFFSLNVEIKQGHKPITTGPFAVVRHPAYLGGLIFYSGMVLAANSLTCASVLLFILVPWYFYRIKIEEKMLQAEFGKEYEAYKKSVPALIPKLF